MYDLPLRSVADLGADAQAAFAVELVHNGGTGARPGKDGLSATAFPSGVWGSQVEITESVAPVLVKRRELRPDSGGAGRYRGGLGQSIELCAARNAPFTVFLSVERIDYPAQGREGGHAGAPGQIRIDDQPPARGKGELTIQPGETLYFDTPGGGGFGPPQSRDRQAVQSDVQLGLVSRAQAVSAYGYSEDSQHD